MLINRGGVYNGYSYSCVIDTDKPPARKSLKGDAYIGIRGCETKNRYMLWFSDKELIFAEPYDPETDRTMTDVNLERFKKILERSKQHA